MARNNELIKVAKRIADAWRNTDEYHEAARIIDVLVSELEEMPALTQPNEPLTCKGCVYHEYDIGLCADCARMQHRVDYYWPKEGKGKA